MPNNDLLFTVIIPTYNYAHVLPRAVKSACLQNGSDFEVIIIDDGSTDNTADVARTLIEQLADDNFKKIQYHRQRNGGPASARNAAIDLSSARYFIFLDADDELLPDALEIFRQSITSAPNAGMHIAPTIAVFPDGKEKISRSPHVSSNPHQRFQDYLHKRLNISNGAVAMHRKLFKSLRFPDLKQTEDIPVFAAALTLADAIGLPQATTKIHKHSDSRRHNIDQALATGQSLINEIFDTGRLTEEYQKYRKPYIARRAMSMFRICYKNNNFSLARKYFHQAIKTNPLEILRKPGNFLKYCRCFIR